MKMRTTETEYIVPVTRGNETSKFFVRMISSEKSKELLKKHTTEIKRRGEPTEKEMDWEAYIADRIDYVITGWDNSEKFGIFDENGNFIEPTRENKIKLYQLNAGIIDEVLEAVRELSDEHNDKYEVLEKN